LNNKRNLKYAIYTKYNPISKQIGQNHARDKTTCAQTVLVILYADAKLKLKV